LYSFFRVFIYLFIYYVKQPGLLSQSCDNARDCTIKESNFDSWEGQGIFFFSRSTRPSLRLTLPPIQWVNVALPAGIREQRRETLSSAENKNAWSCMFALHTS